MGNQSLGGAIMVDAYLLIIKYVITSGPNDRPKSLKLTTTEKYDAALPRRNNHDR